MIWIRDVEPLAERGESDGGGVFGPVAEVSTFSYVLQSHNVFVVMKQCL
jgi:hypothetical protein